MRKFTQNPRSWMGPRPWDYPLGSMQSRAAARAMQLARDLEKQEQRAAQFKDLTPYEKECIELLDDPEAQAGMLYMLRNVIIPKSQRFGLPLPSLEAARQRLKVEKEVKRIAQERAEEDIESLDE